MNQVLGDVLNCAAYLDDVVVYSDTWKQHLELLELVFNLLLNASLVLNLDKCEFGRGVVSYLGKQVGQGVVKPLSAKIQVIRMFPAHKTRHNLCRFLGMAGYYQCFCKNFFNMVHFSLIYYIRICF